MSFADISEDKTLVDNEYVCFIQSVELQQCKLISCTDRNQIIDKMKLGPHILHRDIVNSSGELIRRQDLSRKLFVGILEIANGIAAGKTKRGDTLWYFRPWDSKRFPPFVVARKINIGDNIKRNLIVGIKFENWEICAKYPRGVVEIIFGNVGDNIAEQHAMLCHANYLPLTVYTGRYLRELPLGKDEIEDEMLSKYVKYMKYGGDDDNFRIVNIDPMGCVDIDDAFHWSRDDPDHIYIHIADLSSIAKNYPKLVSQYIEGVSSAYSPNLDIATHHLLPQHIVAKYSLLPGKWRHAITYKFRITSSTHFEFIETSQTLIRNSQSLTYDDADKSSEHFISHEMKIRILTNESAIFRHITPTGNWSEIIQRFMIAVNYYSAIIAHRKHETNYLFCIHPEEGMASQYSATPAIHTGLGLPMYSHISSPIRRVVDFLNQCSLFRDSILHSPIIRQLIPTAQMIEHINEQTRIIRKTQRHAIIYDYFANILSKTDVEYYRKPTEIDISGIIIGWKNGRVGFRVISPITFDVYVRLFQRQIPINVLCELEEVSGIEKIVVMNMIENREYTFRIGEMRMAKLYVYWNETSFQRRIRILFI